MVVNSFVKQIVWSYFYWALHVIDTYLDCQYIGTLQYFFKMSNGVMRASMVYMQSILPDMQIM